MEFRICASLTPWRQGHMTMSPIKPELNTSKWFIHSALSFLSFIMTCMNTKLDICTVKIFNNSKIKSKNGLLAALL